MISGIVPLTIQLTMLFCIICHSGDAIYSCEKCNQVICSECREHCLNCEMEKEFMFSEGEKEMQGVKEMQEEMQEDIQEEEQEEQEEHRMIEFNPSSDKIIAYEYIQEGLPLYDFPRIHPSIEIWRSAEMVLEDFITFTMSDVPQRPVMGTRYLVGRYVMNYPIYPIHSLTTDFIVVYEKQETHEETDVYGWSHYVAMYYDQSPFQYDVNVFYPHPMPIQIYIPMSPY